MNICSLIKELTDYGMNKGLVEPADEIYTVNRLLELFNINEYTPDKTFIRVDLPAPFSPQIA